MKHGFATNMNDERLVFCFGENKRTKQVKVFWKIVKGVGEILWRQL